MKQKYGELEFPKISFCNLNPMKFSKVLENERLFKIINETAEVMKVEILDFGLFIEVITATKRYFTIISKNGLLKVLTT